jgi:drug/metabolite transporter (DMT)-like permease
MNKFIGIGLILISATSFGAMGIFAKLAYTSGISTHSLLFFRFFLALIIMFPIALWQKRRFPVGKDLFILILMGAVGYAGQSFCYFSAITYISPSLVAILLYLYPVIVAVLSVFFLNEKLTINKIIALVLAICGAILVIGFDINGNIKGILFGVGAALIYSVYIIVGARIMKRNDTFVASLVVIGSAALFYFIFNIRSGFFIPSHLTEWSYIIAIAIICTCVAIYTFFHGMNIIGATNASMLSTFEPVTTMALAFLFLGQQIGWLQVAGTALILSSAILIALNSKE